MKKLHPFVVFIAGLAFLAWLAGIQVPFAPKFVSGAQWFIAGSNYPSGFNHCFQLEFAGGGEDWTCVHLSDAEHETVLGMMDRADANGPFAFLVSDPVVVTNEASGHQDLLYTRLLWVQAPPEPDLKEFYDPRS